MRTGAIFARGSCRALKWMALVGMVFALGVGSTAAQTLSLSSTAEGSSPEATVTLARAIPDGGTDINFTLTIVDYDGDVPALTGRRAAPLDSLVGDVGVALNRTTTTLTVAAGERTGTLLAALEFADDGDAEDEYFTLRATGDNSPATVIDLNVVVDDSDDQEYTLELPAAAGGAITEGADPERLTLKADPARTVDIPVALALVDGDLSKYTLGAVMNSNATPAVTEAFGMGDNNPVTASIEAMADGNRKLDKITVTAYTGTLAARETIASLRIDVKDANPLPKVAAMVVDGDGMAFEQQPTSIDEGQTVMVKLTVVDEDRKPTAAVEDLSVQLMQTGSATAGDYRLGMSGTIKITEGKTSSDMFELEARTDGDLDPDETLIFNAVVSGEPEIGSGTETSNSVLRLAIDDQTPLTVTPKSQTEIDKAYMDARALVDDAQNMWMPGGRPLTIALDKLFNLPATGSYDADASSGDATIVTADADADPGATGGGMVTVTPVGKGMTNVHVTVSADTASATIQLSATRARATFSAVVDGISVTAKSGDAINDAYRKARNAASGEDGLWTVGDGPATIPLSELFNNLPASFTPTSTSSNTSAIVASTTATALVLSPVGVGGSSITVTVGGATAPFEASVDDPAWDLRGRIISLTVDDATEKTIDGVKRMHVTEGGITTVTVTVEWTNRQLTALWGNRTLANPPDPAVVWVTETAWTEPVSYRWLSPAEISEVPGESYRGGNDLVFGSRAIQVKIPDKPKTNTDSIYVGDQGTGSTSLSLPHDDDAEAEGFVLGWWPGSSRLVHYDGNLPNNNLLGKTHVVEDDDPQGIVLTRHTKGTIYEGGADVKFRVYADPEREDLPLDVRYDLTDATGVAVSSQTYTLDSPNGQIPARENTLDVEYDEVTLNLDPNDADREDDMLQMHAEVVSYALNTGAYDEIGSKTVDFTVLDRHLLPKLTVMPESVTLMEGAKQEFTVTVDRNPRETRAVDPEKSQYTTEALSIMVSGSGVDSSNYKISPTSIPVPEYKHATDPGKDWMQPVKVTIEAVTDEDVEPDAVLMLDFVVQGTVAANGPSDTKPDGQAAVTLQDATETQVSVRDNAYDVIQGALGTPPMLTTGMSGELIGATLFDYDTSAVSIAYGTSVEGGAVTASASGGTITIMAVAAGEAKVTLTATATPNASSLVTNQTKSNVAQLTFPVMVTEEPLTFTVMDPEEMNLTEGGMGGMVKVMTNRAVSENTEVMLMRDGSSSASDDDYMLDPSLVTIMAGQMEGHTMVMATEDSMAEEMEMLTLFLVVDGMQMTDESVSFYLWDAAVPALPIIAQLLLAAFLALGGYRRYRRR